MTIEIIQMDYADKAHHDFLKEMMYQAIYVAEGEILPDRSIIDLPELKKYIADFGSKVDDVCFIAYDSEKEYNAGAIWLRKFSKENPSYGFVDEDTPELSIAVDYAYRGKGIGTMLIDHAIGNIPKHIKQISLSVDTKNRAYGLYKTIGFKTLFINDGTATMIKSIN